MTKGEIQSRITEALEEVRVLERVLNEHAVAPLREQLIALSRALR